MSAGSYPLLAGVANRVVAYRSESAEEVTSAAEKALKRIEERTARASAVASEAHQRSRVASTWIRRAVAANAKAAGIEVSHQKGAAGLPFGAVAIRDNVPIRFSEDSVGSSPPDAAALSDDAEEYSTKRKRGSRKKKPAPRKRAKRSGPPSPIQREEQEDADITLTPLDPEPGSPRLPSPPRRAPVDSGERFIVSLGYLGPPLAPLHPGQLKAPAKLRGPYKDSPSPAPVVASGSPAADVSAFLTRSPDPTPVRRQTRKQTAAAAALVSPSADSPTPSPAAASSSSPAAASSTTPAAASSSSPELPVSSSRKRAYASRSNSPDDSIGIPLRSPISRHSSDSSGKAKARRQGLSLDYYAGNRTSIKRSNWKWNRPPRRVAAAEALEKLNPPVLGIQQALAVQDIADKRRIDEYDTANATRSRRSQAGEALGSSPPPGEIERLQAKETLSSTGRLSDWRRSVEIPGESEYAKRRADRVTRRLRLKKGGRASSDSDVGEGEGDESQ